MCCRCIGALLRFADDQMVTMARRQLWQARSLHGEEIAKRHAAAVELVRDGQARVAPVTDSLLPSWSVQSGADSSQLHQVEQEQRQCPETRLPAALPGLGSLHSPLPVQLSGLDEPQAHL